MANEPYGFVTVTGRAKKAAAFANGTAFKVADLAWGDGARAITGGETALENETGRAPVDAWEVDANNPNVARFFHHFGEMDGPYTIAEAGIFDVDGDLIAIVAFPTPFSKPLHFNPTMGVAVAFSDLENLQIELTAPSSLVPGGRRVTAGFGMTGGGDLSADRRFDLDFATEFQARAGTRTDKVMSPALTAIAVGDALASHPKLQHGRARRSYFGGL